AVAGPGQGDLVAEPGQGLLVVAGEVLAVAVITLLVVLLAGLGVVFVVFQDGPGDADQGVADGEGGLFLVAAAEPAGPGAETGPRPGARHANPPHPISPLPTI